MVGLGMSLDALTDIMSKSTDSSPARPTTNSTCSREHSILILRQLNIKARQKTAVGSFLCLSLAMVAIALTRASNLHSKSTGPVALDFIYQSLLLLLEATVAVLMAFLTAYRTFFVAQTERKRRQERMKRPAYSFKRFAFRKTTHDEEARLPEIPRATMTGIRSFLQRTNRTVGESTTILPHKNEEVRSEFSVPTSFITKPSFLKDQAISVASSSNRQSRLSEPRTVDHVVETL